MIGFSCYPGSAGELAQGTIGGAHFLITCPVDRFSFVQATLTGRKRGAIKKEVRSFDGHSAVYEGGPEVRKIEAAVNVFRTRYNVASGYDIYAISEIPVGKGMASSSADIAATLQACAEAAEMTLSPEEIAELAGAIEPTDGIFVPDIAMYDHVNGQIIRSLGEIDFLDVILLDLGGEIDTLSHHAKRATNTPKEEEYLEQAVAFISEGIREQDATMVGKGSTLSAFINQRYLEKPGLTEILSIAKDHGSVGLTVAHSGTVVGVLFEKHKENSRIAKELVGSLDQRGVPFVSSSGILDIIPGGESDPQNVTEMISGPTESGESLISYN